MMHGQRNIHILCFSALCNAIKCRLVIVNACNLLSPHKVLSSSLVSESLKIKDYD